MPLKRYDKAFGGKRGSAAKAHKDMMDEYGPKKGESVFYATKNKKMKSKMPEGGSLTPKGDIGELRQKESEKVGGFKDGAIVRASSALPVRPHKAAKGD